MIIVIESIDGNGKPSVYTTEVKVCDASALFDVLAEFSLENEANEILRIYQDGLRLGRDDCEY